MMIEDKQEAKTDIAQHQGDRIEIVYYTDPLCCWSWAMEEALGRLLEEQGQRINLRYCMGGLIPDWTSYNDPINAVTKPIQLGPVWMEVRHLTGVPIHERIWVDNPPASSYPACIAVKAAGLQSKEAEREYLYLIRKAVMTEGKNIAKNAALFETAEQIQSPFDLEQFSNDLLKGPGKAAFLEDLKEVRTEQINQFPTLIFRGHNKGIVVTRYKRYEVLSEVVSRLRD
jgi:predicted DsbA family dithiol-disulfide isomerase